MQRAEAQARLRAIPTEHVSLRGMSSPAILDELLERGVRALSILGSHAQVSSALLAHPLVHQLAWIRADETRLDRTFWDALERVAPKALLYVDAGRGVSIEAQEVIDGDTIASIDEATLVRPCWRCPSTTWGPRPTLTRVLACADAIRAGAKRPKPGMFSYETSMARDVDRPPRTFAEVVAPETWDPEKE